MTNDRTIRLGDALDRLNDELDTLAEQAANDRLPADAQPAEVEAQRNGVAYLIHGDDEPADEAAGVGEDGFTGYGPDGEVTVRAIRTGLYGDVEERVSDAQKRRREQGQQRESNVGTTRLAYVAQGCISAPFYDEHMRDLEDRINTVRGLPIEVAKWLEAEIDDVTTVDPGNEKSFADLYREKTQSAAGETSATPPESS